MPASPDNVQALRSAPKPLTVPAITALKPGKMLADGSITPGSGRLKVRKRALVSGVVTEWVFFYHAEGSRHKLVMGRYSPRPGPGEFSLESAREEARRLQALVRAGLDPLQQRVIVRDATRAAEAAAVAQVRASAEKTLKALLDAYVALLQAKGKQSVYDVENLFSNHVEKAFPDIADMPAAEVTSQHIARILARLVGPEVENKKGRTAVKLRSYLAAAFKLALGAGVNPMAGAAAAGFGLTSNPAAAVPVADMALEFNKAGNRTLSPDELRAYLEHVGALPSLVTRAALQLQVVSGGQRVQQLLRLTWEDVDVKSFTLWDPKGRRAQPRAHVLPIVQEVQEIFEALRELNPDGLLFGALAPETLSVAVNEISTDMYGIEGDADHFRGGDIRRTVETLLAEKLRLGKDDRAQLLSHGIGGVQDTHYDKSLHLDAKLAALRAWNNWLADLCIGGDSVGNVVALHRAA